jgi:ribosomal protein S18 acetylase RimI-like enzyme
MIGRMGTLAFRAAALADVPSLMELASRMANFELPPWRTAAEVIAADGQAMVAAVRAADPDSEVFIAERDGVTAGCLHMVVTADFFGSRHAHISVIATSADAEGAGVGRALMAFAEDWARARQLPLITLNVFATNARARRLYERAGFDVELVKYAKRV